MRGNWLEAILRTISWRRPNGSKKSNGREKGKSDQSAIYRKLIGKVDETFEDDWGMNFIVADMLHRLNSIE